MFQLNIELKNIPLQNENTLKDFLNILNQQEVLEKVEYGDYESIGNIFQSWLSSFYLPCNPFKNFMQINLQLVVNTNSNLRIAYIVKFDNSKCKYERTLAEFIYEPEIKQEEVNETREN